MLLFWGYPTHNTTFCVSQSTVGTWKECMDLCLASDMCMLSYGSETSCILCDIFAITKILQTDSSGGIMVAVKVDQQDQCPADVTKQPYTRTNGPGGYKMELFNDPEPNWSITYEKRCIDDTWRMFPRPVGLTCIKVNKNFRTLKKNYFEVLGTRGKNFPNASVECENFGPGIRVGGFQTKQEFDYIHESAKAIPPVFSRNYKTVWLSGKMKTRCTGIPTPADCTRINISFPISLIIGNNANIFAIVFDIISTPLIVQISYLLNNRKSLKQALTTFKFANFIRVLLDIEVKSTVEPIPNDQPISIQMKTVDNK
uniref:CW domain-containing protein n=1 Tax=Caenorhabditis tropicalis TaxID=1561998 RepID=A0A1I7U6J7_9PELO